MFTHGIKKNHGILNVGQKNPPNYFVGIKGIPSIKTSKNNNIKAILPNEQYANSKEVQFHPTGLGNKHIPNRINTLERKSK